MAVLLALNAEGYWILSGDMDANQRGLAHAIGLAGVANISAGLMICFVRRWVARSAVGTAGDSWIWGSAAIAVNVAYVWIALGLGDEVLPRGASLWIYPPERFFGHQLMFAMLPLFVGVLQVSCVGVARRLGVTLAWSLGVAVMAPVLLYLVLQGAAFGGRGSDGVILAVCLVLFSLAMFIGIVRAMMVGLKFASRWRRVSEAAAIAIFAVLLPAGALAVNRSIAFPVDFQAWEVYVLAGLNALVMFVASSQRDQRPRLALNLLSGTLPFSLYFFLVVLPYTPLAIFAVLLAGFGFLLLAPIVLFVLHLYLLNRARVAANGANWRRTIVPAVACFLVLPGFLICRAYADRSSLHTAIDYVFAPIVRQEGAHFRGDVTRTRRALTAYRQFKDGVYYPFLSDFYNWVVFDNLVLPDAKLAELERTFGTAIADDESHGRDRRRRESFAWGSSVRDQLRMPQRRAVPQTVRATHIGCQANSSRHDGRSYTLGFELENTGRENAEYVTSFPVPSGVVVNGFRLQVGDAMVAGRIFEKKTALWVYAMIRDGERRDPGVLYYRNAEELELRVFPVVAGKPPRVEIDFLLPPGDAPKFPTEPAVGMAVRGLGDGVAPQSFTVDGHVVFVAGKLASALPVVDRRPYLHLIIDRSEDNGFDGRWEPVVEALRSRFPATNGVRVTAANVDVRDLTTELVGLPRLADLASSAALNRTLACGNGCAIDLAITHALRLHRDLDLDRLSTSDPVPPRPVIVIVGRTVQKHLPDLPLAEAWSDFSGGLEIVQVGANGEVVANRAPRQPAVPLLRLGRILRPLAAGGMAVFPASTEAGLEYWSPASVMWRPVPVEPAESHAHDWERAISLWLQSRDYARSPGERAFALPELVGASRDSGVLIPATSYIVVESQAQWRMLQLSERQKLGQNSVLEFRETPVPSTVWVVAGFVVWLGLRRCRRLRRFADELTRSRPARRSGAAPGR